jgi:rhodanese-related sulfurtransferase
VIKGALILIAMTLVAAAATHFLHPQAPLWYESDIPREPDEVTVADVHQRWHNDVLWIDARIDEEFKKAHIPGAISINEQHRDDQLIEHLDVLQDNKKPVVIYCDGHACQASRKMRTYFLESTPFTRDVWVLKGGWPSWQKASVRR